MTAKSTRTPEKAALEATMVSEEAADAAFVGFLNAHEYVRSGIKQLTQLARRTSDGQRKRDLEGQRAVFKSLGAELELIHESVIARRDRNAITEAELRLEIGYVALVEGRLRAEIKLARALHKLRLDSNYKDRTNLLVARKALRAVFDGSQGEYQAPGLKELRESGKLTDQDLEQNAEFIAAFTEKYAKFISPSGRNQLGEKIQDISASDGDQDPSVVLVEKVDADKVVIQKQYAIAIEIIKYKIELARYEIDKGRTQAYVVAQQQTESSAIRRSELRGQRRADFGVEIPEEFHESRTVKSFLGHPADAPGLTDYRRDAIKQQKVNEALLRRLQQSAERIERIDEEDVDTLIKYRDLFYSLVSQGKLRVAY